MKKILSLVFICFVYIGECWGDPIIDGPSEVVVKAGTYLHLHCKGESGGLLYWKYPAFTADDADESEFEELTNSTTNTLIVLSPHYLNTGFYTCHEHNNDKIARVYVYVSDTDHLLVANDSYMIISGLQDETIVIPCRPTSPNVSVTLSNDHGAVNLPSDAYDPKIGFTLANVKVSDSNNYFCQASNEDATDSLDFSVTISPRSKMLSTPHIVEDNLIGLQVFQDATLTCEITIEMGVRFLFDWILPNDAHESERIKKLPPKEVLKDNRHKLYSKSLIIKNVTKEDEGVYTCKISSDANMAFATHHLHVHWPNETFINMSVDNEYIEERVKTKEARWVGRIYDHPPATLMWLNPSGQDISLFSVPGKYKMSRNGTYFVLRIFNITSLDSGRYRLIASNGEQTRHFHLKLAVRSKPEVDVKAEELYAVDTVANITCRVIGFPPPRVVWLTKNCDVQSDTNCDPGNAIPVPGDLISEMQHENMISSTVQWPMKLPGLLICSASNEEGDGEDWVRLRVTDVLEGFSLSAPEEVVEGDNVVLSCAVTTYYYAEQLEWLYAADDGDSPVAVEAKDDISLDIVPGVYSTRTILRISNAKGDHNGVYICQSKSRYNSTIYEKIANITVLDLVPPEIVDSNLNGSVVTLSSWNPVEWRCDVVGMPPPRIRWYHNGILIDVNNVSGLELRDSNQTLALLSLTVEDEGEYECRATNKGGESSAFVTLQLLGKESIPIALIAGIVVALAVLIPLLIILIVRLYRERRRRKELSLVGLLNFQNGAVDSINPDMLLHEQADLLPYHSKWEFPRHKLKLGKQLGCGAFGVVLKAEAIGIVPSEEKTTVAVKMVKRHSDGALVRALASELKIMAHLGRHPHVVNLLGAVTEQLAQRELLLIVEFCKFGNLNNYLQQNRSRYIDQVDPSTGLLDLSRATPIGYERNSLESAQFSGVSGNTESTLVSCNSPRGFEGDYKFDDFLPLSTSVLVGWSYQIARGMEWLASRRVLHGDLAARNILLAENNIVKICDFGLARSIYASAEYRKTGGDPLPIKWMAIESIRDKRFSTQSDVWSFGVVLWELFSLARTPYPAMGFSEILSKLESGYRMEKPDYSPPKVYTIMLECWSADPAKRPSFMELSCKIGTLLEDTEREHYLELEDTYRKLESAPEHDYLSMVRAPNFDNNSHTYVNAPPSPSYVDMDGENHELKPMLQQSQSADSDDYLKPRDTPFIPTAVSNPSYNPVVPAPLDTKNYGKIIRTPVKDNISFFESFRKKDARH